MKFYKNISSAIHDVAKELDNHLKVDYLRREFAWIGSKMNADDPHYDQLAKTLNKNTSLDKVFPVLHVPVLLTYESPTVGSHDIVDADYEDQIRVEFLKHFDAFNAKCAIEHVAVHLMLVPMHTKADLVDNFDARLKALQAINGAS